MQTTSIFSNVYTSKYFANLPEFQKRRAQAFLTFALTVVAICFFGLFAIMPTVSTIANLQKQQEDNNFVEEKLDQKKTNLTNLSTAYTSLDPDLPLVYAALPKDAQLSQLIGQLYALGQNADVQIARIQESEIEITKTQEGAAQFSSFPLSIEATGSYTNLSKYLTLLTNFERVISITSISMTKGEGNVLKLNVQAKAYFKL